MSREEQDQSRIKIGRDLSRKVWTLTQLNQSLENLFQEKFGNTSYWITCEITKINGSGRHKYLELTDSVDGLKTAESRAAIWNGQYAFICKTIEKAGEDVNKILAPGNKVLVRVTITYHKIYGLSLVIVDLDPYFTLGDIERQKQETLRRLQRENLIDRQKEKYLPTIAKRIALVGSPDTSGFTDFLREIYYNDIYTNFLVEEFHTRVQGEGAVSEIARSVRQADLYDVDVIVIVRGGGSKMDLHTFNHYDICKAIANAEHPVITGIGHETDISLADLVAHHYEKTPTAAARNFYMKIGVFKSRLREAYDIMKFEAFGLLQQETRTLRNRSTMVHHKVMLNLRTSKERLRITTDRAVRLINTHLRDHHEILTGKINQLKHSLMEIIHNKRSDLREIDQDIFKSTLYTIGIHKEEIRNRDQLLKIYVEHCINQQERRLELIFQKICILDPSKLLARGYTLSTVDGRDVMELGNDAMGKTMKTLTIDRIYYSTITDIKNTNHDREGN